MKEKDFIELQRIRTAVMRAIRDELAIDNYCKSYEGTFELTICWPDYFEDSSDAAEPNFYKLTLHCYVLGPNRHYDWFGKTLAESLESCRRDVEAWGAKL